MIKNKLGSRLNIFLLIVISLFVFLVAYAALTPHYRLFFNFENSQHSITKIEIIAHDTHYAEDGSSTSYSTIIDSLTPYKEILPTTTSFNIPADVEGEFSLEIKVTTQNGSVFTTDLYQETSYRGYIYLNLQADKLSADFTHTFFF